MVKETIYVIALTELQRLLTKMRALPNVNMSNLAIGDV